MCILTYKVFCALRGKVYKIINRILYLDKRLQELYTSALHCAASEKIKCYCKIITKLSILEEYIGTILSYILCDKFSS